MNYMLTVNGLTNLDENLRIASEHKIKEIELLLSKEEVISLDDIHMPNKLNELLLKFRKFNIKFNGIAIRSDFSLSEGIMIAKKCVIILKKSNASNLRLEYINEDVELVPNVIGCIVGFINSVGRYASYDADYSRTVTIGYDLFTNRNTTFDIINKLVRKHQSGCLGVAINSHTLRKEELTQIMNECNGFEFNINNLVITDDDGIEYAETFIERASYAYDRTVSLCVKPENIEKYCNLLDKYSFDINRVDYLKTSYPSSVCRYFTDEGSAYLTPDCDIVAGSIGKYSVTYTVDDKDICTNGGLKFTMHHSTDWQKLTSDFGGLNLNNPNEGSYISVKTTGNIKYSVKQLNEDATMVVNVVIHEGKLKKGDTVTVTYGDCKKGISAQTFRQYAFSFYIFIDFTGYGNYFAYRNPPTVKIIPGSVYKCFLVAPSVVQAGEKFKVGIRVEDKFGNEVWGYKKPFAIKLNNKELIYDRVEWHRNGGSATVYGLSINEEGVNKLSLYMDVGLSTTSNYIDSRKNAFPLWWGDMHCHLGYMDSVGTVDEFYDFAQNVSFLDFVCHSEHMDSFSGGRQCSNNQQWQIIRNNANKANQEGKFVSLLGFENSETWDANLYFEDDCEQWHVDSFAKGLFSWAKEHDAIVIPHMTTYPQRIRGYDWDCYDPEVIPAAEIYSCHGSSEYFGCEDFLTNCEPGGYILEALERGYKIGFIASGDGHSGMPGNTVSIKMINGLIAARSKELTRKGIIGSIKSRQTYATNNRRILADFKVNSSSFGSILPYTADVQLDVEVYGTDIIDYVEIVKNGIIIKTVNPNSDKIQFTHKDFNVGDRDTYYYVRIVQKDNGRCWLSPVYINKNIKN